MNALILVAVNYAECEADFRVMYNDSGGEALNWLPRMGSNHDKVIQSHLVHDGCAIVATFSDFRAASLPVCPSSPSS